MRFWQRKLKLNYRRMKRRENSKKLNFRGRSWSKSLLKMILKIID
jgi:hypothetical protein